MHFVLWQTLQHISGEDDKTVLCVLDSESKRLEVTKSVLNVLHNIVQVRNITLTERQKANFANHSKVVKEIFKRRQLRAKKHLLLKNPELVRLIAGSCPTPRPGESSC